MALDTQVHLAAADYYRQVFMTTLSAADPFYPAVSTEIPSTRESEPYAMLGAVPGMREWLGERMLKELRASNNQIDNFDRPLGK